MALPGTTRPLASRMLPCATVHPKPAAESTKTMLSTKEPTEKLHSAPKELLLKLKKEHSHGGSEREEVENDRLRTLPAHESDQSTHFDGLGRLALKIPAEMLASHSPLKGPHSARWRQASQSTEHAVELIDGGSAPTGPTEVASRLLRAGYEEPERALPASSQN